MAMPFLTTAGLTTMSNLVGMRLAWMAFVSRGGDIPPTLPVIFGVTAGALVFLLVGAYWSILVLTPDGRRSL